MRYNVAQLLKQPTGSSRKYEFCEQIDDLDEGINPLAPLQGHIKLMRTASGVLVTGRLHTIVELTCTRCLESLAAEVSLSLEEEFRPTVDITTGATLPLAATDEEATRIDGHHVIDLTEVVRQGVILSLPMYSLCRPDCLGFCPQCGQNLNEGTCQCQAITVDPRLAVLEELLKETKASS